VIQARLSNEGYVVCANGYLEGEASPEQRASDLDEALTEAGITGPYVLVAAGDGVHSTRLFADGRDDIEGVVLVDPVPVGFQDVFDQALPPDTGSPAWVDIDPAVSASLDDLGDMPLVVIGADPEAVFLSQSFINGFGRETGEALNNAWQDGLDFYAALSTNNRSVVAERTGMHMVVWNQPDVIIEEVLSVAGSPGQ
jgi:pimeloyl-ACP methyl ester carboxylesterase